MAKMMVKLVIREGNNLQELSTLSVEISSNLFHNPRKNYDIKYIVIDEKDADKLNKVTITHSILNEFTISRIMVNNQRFNLFTIEDLIYIINNFQVRDYLINEKF